jgi:hypothetical protein
MQNIQRNFTEGKDIPSYPDGWSWKERNAKKATVLLLACLFLLSLAKAQVDSTKINAGDFVQVCHVTPEYIQSRNDLAHNSPDDGVRGRGIPNYTPQTSFASNAIITCGRFRIYYEDMNQATTDGFDAGGTLGSDRRNTLCDVLTYVDNTFDLTAVNGTTDFIDIYVERSIATFNQATTSSTFLANAGPYYPPGTYGVAQGYFDGDFFTHGTTGNDLDPGIYDAHIEVNFDAYYDANSSTFFPITYWNNWQNRTGTCAFDLYSVLLHEVTHAMGFVSAVKESSALGHPAICGNSANSFTTFDDHFLFNGNPCTGLFDKVVVGTSPVINAALPSDPCRMNSVWLTSTGAPDNQPIYSGTLDAFYPLMPGSLMTHLSGNILAYTAQSQFAPGYQPNYVMGPGIGIGQLKRTWTIPEHRILMTLGYQLRPAFAAATNLLLSTHDLTETNGTMLTNNTPPYRTNCSTPELSYYGPFNFMELMTADFSMVNNNAPPPGNPSASSQTITISSLTNINDNQTGTQIFVAPNSLFGIRGVSNTGWNNGGNDHNCLQEVLDANGRIIQIIYTPLPGFHGRAQFGFYLSDGNERGALRIVTIDVSPGSYTLNPGDQMVVYPDLEDGTEVRQRVLNPNVEHTQIEDWSYEGIWGGRNMSGGHNYNWETNNWNLGGGDITENAWYACFMGINTQNGYFGSATSDWNPSGYGGLQYPTPVTMPNGNQRYHNFQGDHNYSTLINQAADCNIYRFECDLNFEKTNFQVGQTFQFQLQFVDNPSPGHHTQLYYSAPVQVTISTVAPDTWQHVTFDFQYCGTPTYFMNLLVEGIVASHVVVTGDGGSPLIKTFTAAWYSPINCPFIDNITMKQIYATPPPVTLNVSANPTTVCNGSTTTLTALPVNYLPCNATYTWNPGNLNGYTATSGPVTSTTTFTATVNYACNQTASGTVTVTPSAIPVITAMGPYCSTNTTLYALSATPSGGTFTGNGVSGTNPNYYFQPSAAGAGTHIITYTYIPFAGCTTIVTIPIVVNSPPAISITQIGPFCSTNSTPQLLSATPSGGTFSGTGVTLVGTSYYFTPSTAGAGNWIITYTATNGPCSASGTMTVSVVAPAIVSITPQAPICINYTPVQLYATPAGGTWSGGPYLDPSSAQFDPSISGAGTFTVTYTVSGGVCGPQSATAQIVVLPGVYANWPKFIENLNVRSEGYGVTADASGNVYVTGYVNAPSGSPGHITGASSSTIVTQGPDVFVAKFTDQCGLVWYQQFGGAGTDEGHDVLVDPSGANVYICGKVGGAFSFGTYNGNVGTNTTAFVARLDAATGNPTGLAYGTTTATNMQAVGLSLARRSSGEIYMTGTYTQPIMFSPMAALGAITPGTADVFVAEFNSALTACSWRDRIYSSGTNADFAGGISLDNSDNVYVGCTVYGAGVANSTSYSSSGTTGYHPFVVKYNSANTFVGARIHGTSGNNAYLRDLVVDAAGKIYFCGNFSGSISFFNTYTTALGDKQIYATRMEPGLTYNSSCWATVVGTATNGNEDARGINLGANGDIYFTGYAVNGSSFPSYTPSSITGTATGGSQVYVARINSAGVPQELSFCTSSTMVGGGNFGDAVAYCSGTNAHYFTGACQPPTTFGSLGTFSYNGSSYAMFAARLASAGSFYRTGNPDEEETASAILPEMNEEVGLYPNPNSGEFMLVFRDSIPANCRIIITDAAGRALDREAFSYEFNGNAMSVQIPDAINGLYFIEIISDSGIITKKVILNR